MPEPLEVARELNQYWASVPFETLREAWAGLTAEASDYEQLGDRVLVG